MSLSLTALPLFTFQTSKAHSQTEPLSLSLTHAHMHTYTNTLTRSFSVLLAVSYLSSEIFRPLFFQKGFPLNEPPKNFATFTLNHCWQSKKRDYIQSKKWDYIKTHTMQMLSCMYARLLLKTEEK